MKVGMPGTIARHRTWQELTAPADDPNPESGGRLLQWVGLVTVAAATGVVITFAAPAPQAQAAAPQAARAVQSAAPTTSPPSPGDEGENALRKLREYAKTVKDAPTRRLLSYYLDLADKYPGRTCLGRCLAEEFFKGGGSLSGSSVAKYLINCSLKCASEVRDELLDKGLREELRKAEKDALDRVNALKQKANDRTLDPVKRAEAREELKRANKELNDMRRIRAGYERARNLIKRADKHQMAAKRTTDAKTRARELRAAERLRKQGKEALERLYRERPSARDSRGRADGTSGRSVDRSGRAGNGTSRPKGKVPRWLRKIFPGLGLFALAEAVDDASREAANLQERARQSAERLKSYLEEHPREAEQLMTLARQGELPLLDPDKLDEFLREWDANHDDVTGEDTRSWCEIVAQLGASCGTEPVSWRDFDSPRDRDEDSWVNRRGPILRDYGPGERRFDRYQPTRYPSDTHPSEEYWTSGYENPSYTGTDVGVLVMDSGATEQDTGKTTKSTASKPKKESRSTRTKRTTRKADSGGSRRQSTVTTSPTTRTTTTSTTRSTTRSTTTNTTTTSKNKSKSKSDSTAAARDRALQQLAKEKSSQFQADRARDALIRDKKQAYEQMTTREKA